MKPPPKRRRPYRRPQVVSEKIYERYGLACGKANPANPSCTKNIMS